MLGSTAEKKRVIFLIEWKYTECYEPDDLFISRRSDVYDPLIRGADGPFVSDLKPRSLYFEPFYQMMRQTLLAWQFEKHGELECSRCVNVHVIPKENKDLKETVTAPDLRGRNIHDAWQNVLKSPTKYIPLDPYEMLKDARNLPDAKSWLAYLKARYW
jgi:hypothetical protein